MRVSLLLLAVIGICLATATRSGAQQLAYKQDFEHEIGPEWSIRQADTTPSGGRKFLGQLGAETVALTLKDLPSHTTVTISLDLYVMNSWDGNSTDHGPDIWDLSIQGGPTLLHTTFTNWDSLGFKQAYPGAHPDGDHPARTGAAESNTLGYTYGGDSVYHLESSFPHTAKMITIRFAASGIVNAGLTPQMDESWGLDNVVVRTSSPEAEAQSHYLAGEKAYKLGDFPTAVAEWEQVLRLKPGSEHTKKMLAKVREMVEKDDPKAHEFYAEGEKAFKQGDYRTAIAKWESALLYKPHSEGTKKMLARAYAALTPQLIGSVTSRVPEERTSAKAHEQATPPRFSCVLKVLQGGPFLYGRRSWIAGLYVQNNGSQPTPPIEAIILNFDDHSMAFLLPVKESLGKYGIPELAPAESTRVAPGTLRDIVYYADDSSPNDAKKPTYGSVLYKGGRLNVPVSP